MKKVCFVDLVGFKFEFVKIIILFSSEDNLCFVVGVRKNYCDMNGNLLRRWVKGLFLFFVWLVL